MTLRLALALCLLALPALADQRAVAPGTGLAAAIAGAAPGDVLLLQEGDYPGPVRIDRPLTLRGPRGARVDGLGQGTVITIAAPDVALEGFSVTGSGNANADLDSGVKILKRADRARISGLLLQDNMHGDRKSVV